MSYYQQQANSNFYQSQSQPGFGSSVPVINNSNGINNNSNMFSGSIPTGSMQTNYAYGEQDAQQLSMGILAAFSATGYPGEPPLLEELGINFGHIKSKTLAVLSFKSSSISEEIVQDSDLAGPLIFCLLFGTFLLISGKTHFGYIYGVALFGTTSLHWLFKLMSNSSMENNIDFLRTASVIGYCLLPLVMLSGLAVLVRLDNTLGYLFSFTSIAWCTFSSSGFFVRVLSLSNARPLIAYPLAMFYSVFALMAIFVEKN
ncbi:hypothetical protein CANARDRAFT_5818 [[Candida] arabinofermentans NRRL YB-2248]|uniref:Protein YIP n=1 Tax=[Candida] arabinofermentans NRRL YB-2248 TaxID=983967 RepID=A0A1E4T6D3_9ASCO|nr:hypothetical protein CANARDRAFT_5818 [[Candida] arabinofermentans NRRL YB-2248]